MSILTLPAFNPFAFADRLKKAGIPPVQAEAEAEALHDAFVQQNQVFSELEGQIKTLAADTKRDAEQMATKGDIAGVRSEISDLRGELRGEISDLRGEVVELRGDVVALRGGVISMRGDIKLLYWMLMTLIGLMTAALSGVGALVLKTFA